MSERDLQIATATLLRRLGWLAWHTPNEAVAKSRRLEGHRLGVLAGVPDWIIAEEHPDGSPVALELKTDRGRVSDAQKRVLEALRARGWHCVVCRSMDDVLDVLRAVRAQNGRSVA